MSSRLRGGALLLAAIALLLPPTLTAAVHPSPAAAGEQDDDPAAQVVVLVNAERAAGGLPALAINAALRDDAQAYARLMASRGWFSHEGPDGSTMIDRAETAGYGQWRFLGENLARGHPTPGRVVAAWLVSPTHRANLLTVEGGEIGVGYARETDGGQRHFWALVVGSRGCAPAHRRRASGRFGRARGGLPAPPPGRRDVGGRQPDAGSLIAAWPERPAPAVDLLERPAPDRPVGGERPLGSLD